MSTNETNLPTTLTATQLPNKISKQYVAKEWKLVATPKFNIFFEAIMYSVQGVFFRSISTVYALHFTERMTCTR